MLTPASNTRRRKSFTIVGTDEPKTMNTDDQVCVAGLLEGGAAFSIHYRGGVSRGTNLLWEINGTEGDLQLSAGNRPSGRDQSGKLTKPDARAGLTGLTAGLIGLSIRLPNS